MRQTMILTGGINLKTVTDPTIPFGRVTKELGEADLVFANLECLLADPPTAYATNQAAFHTTREGFYAGPVAGEALKLAGFAGVGCANNVTYGEDAIRASLARLQELGIPVTGAGLNREEAHRPLIIEKSGVRFGFMQRTSIFWPRGQAAGPLSPGVATLAAHTAYQPRVANRAGVPPIILTMADDTELDAYLEDLTALRPQVDILISSHHWGLRDEVLQGECRDFRGSIRNPMTRDEHDVKYRDCAKRVLPPEDIDRVRDMVENLERLADIRQLIALLAPSPKGEERPA